MQFGGELFQPAEMEDAPQADEHRLGRVVPEGRWAWQPGPLNHSAGQLVGMVLGIAAIALLARIEQLLAPGFGTYGDVLKLTPLGGLLPWSSQGAAAFEDEAVEPVGGADDLGDGPAESVGRAIVTRAAPAQPTIIAKQREAGLQPQVNRQ